MVYLNHCKEFLLIWLFSYFVIYIAINEILPFVTITRLFKFNLPISNRGMGNKLPATSYGTRKVGEGGIGAPGYVPKFFRLHALFARYMLPSPNSGPTQGKGFPVGGGVNHRGGAPTYDFAKFCEKLHEIEKILGRRRGAPLNLPLLRYPHGESFL